MNQAANAAFWDRIAEDYARKPWPNPDSTARRLAITRSLLRPTDRLLDLGCGTGTMLLELAPDVADAEGLDVSPEMIRIARGKPAPSGNVRFAVGGADVLRHADASLDVVTAFNLIHLVDDPLASLREIRRVLKPGGWFVASTACLGGSWWPPYSLLIPVMQWFGKAPSVHCFPEDDLRRWYGEAGFTELTAHDVGAEATQPFFTARVPEA